MMLGQVVVLVTICAVVSLVNSKVSLLAPTPTTTMVKQQNRVQPSIDGQPTQKRVKLTQPKGQGFRNNERAKTTRKGPLSSSIRRTKPTMVHPTSYLSLAITCHNAAIEVSLDEYVDLRFC